MSRTSRTGIVDAGVAASKAEMLTTESTTVETARSNFDAAVRFLCDVWSPGSLPPTGWLRQVNALLTYGFVREPGQLRSWESYEYGYLPADEVATALVQFEEQVASRPQSASCVDMFAWTHWQLNLRGHFFADGCGRTAVVVAAWQTWLYCDSIHDLPPRSAYLELARHAGFVQFAREFGRLAPHPATTGSTWIGDSAPGSSGA